MGVSLRVSRRDWLGAGSCSRLSCYTPKKLIDSRHEHDYLTSSSLEASNLYAPGYSHVLGDGHLPCTQLLAYLVSICHGLFRSMVRTALFG